MHPSPLVGITCDLVPHPRSSRPTCSVALAYAQCVARAGGTPLLLAPMPELVAGHLDACDAFLLTGGEDPRTEPFGQPTHPNAFVMDPQRQEYEVALLRALATLRPDAPVLGICLGMQLMALVAGGALDQHLPDTLATHADHAAKDHPVHPEPDPSGLFASAPARAGLQFAGLAASHHRQAVDNPGSLLVLARAHDGVIEAVGDPRRKFYVGVQWHPERTSDERPGQRVFDAFVRAARA